MNHSRRHVLAGAGAVGASVLGLGYWQRRRLVRFPTTRELRDVVGIEVPEFERDLIITPSLLDAAYTRAVDRFDEIESRLDPPLERYSMEFVEELRAELIDDAPDNVTVPSHGAPAMHAARRQTMAMYGIRRARLVSILAENSPGELPPERYEAQSTTVRERMDSLTVPYRGATVGEAIVSGSTIEWAIGTAESRLERAENEADHPARWQHLERAITASEDAESVVNARDGSDYGDDLPDIAAQLVDEFDQRKEEAPEPIVQEASDSEAFVPSFTNNAIVGLHQSMRNLGGAPSYGRAPFRDGRYGRAAHTYALLLPTIPLYEAFADIPQDNWWEELDYERAATTADLREEKNATIDAVEPYLDASDPLVAHLAAVPLGLLQDVDSRLETMIEDANTLDDSGWARHRDRALLEYESARRYAAAIEETTDIVTAV